MRALLLAVMAIVVALAFIPGGNLDDAAPPSGAEAALHLAAAASVVDDRVQCKTSPADRLVYCAVLGYDLKAVARTLLSVAAKNDLRLRGWRLMLVDRTGAGIEVDF